MEGGKGELVVAGEKKEQQDLVCIWEIFLKPFLAKEEMVEYG